MSPTATYVASVLKNDEAVCKQGILSIHIVKNNREGHTLEILAAETLSKALRVPSKDDSEPASSYETGMISERTVCFRHITNLRTERRYKAISALRRVGRGELGFRDCLLKVFRLDRRDRENGG